MTKEEIYEFYWKQLVALKKQFSGLDLEFDTRFLNLKTQLEQERNNLLIIHGHTSRFNP